MGLTISDHSSGAPKRAHRHLEFCVHIMLYFPNKRFFEKRVLGITTVDTIIYLLEINEVQV